MTNAGWPADPRPWVVGLFLLVPMLALFGSAALGERAARRALPRIAARLGCELSAGRIEVLGPRVVLSQAALHGDGIDAELPRIELRFDVLSLLRGRLRPRSLAILGGHVRARVDDDADTEDVRDLLRRLLRRKAGGHGAGGAPARLALRDLHVDVTYKDLRAHAGRVDVTARRGVVVDLAVAELEVERRGAPLRLQLDRATLRLLPAPGRLLPTLDRTTLYIEGALLSVHGRSPWPALSGWISADRGGRAQFALRTPDGAAPPGELEGTLAVRRAPAPEGAWDFTAALRTAGLTLDDRRLAAAPVRDLSLALSLAGRAESDAGGRRLVLRRGDLRIGELAVELTAEVALGADRDAADLRDRLRRFSVGLRVPPLPCQRALGALAAGLAPRLRGFALRGEYAAELALSIDFTRLARRAAPGPAAGPDGPVTPADAVQLTGDLGLGGCEVEGAPPERSAERLLRPAAGEVPLGAVPPHLVGAVLTTEDHEFFTHRGFSLAYLRDALREDLELGRVHTGASTITMQMVKNALLSPERTLSRKIEELFLTWYVERHLSKRRILEVYLNLAEFGPDLRGVGPAARHFFGKAPRELGPRESAWLVSLLPSPRRRYADFCKGRLDDAREAQLGHILTRMYRLGRLSEGDFDVAVHERLSFRRPRTPPPACQAVGT